MNQDFQNMMAELKKEYIQELPDKISHLESLMSPPNQAELESEFHKLKGTGKTYGLPEVTEICEKAEDYCETGKDGWEAVSQTAIDELKKVVEQYS